MILAAVVSCALVPWWAPPLTLALFAAVLFGLTAYADARLPLPRRRGDES